MEFIKSLWSSLVSFTDAKDTISLILLFVIPLLAPLFSSPSRKGWRLNLMWGKIKQFWSHSPYRWLVILFILLIMTVKAEYDLYDKQEMQIIELQNKISSLEQEYRPIITLDPAITLNPSVDETNQSVNLSINIRVNNISDRPAYQSNSSLCLAPLDQPEKLLRYNNLYETNPIYKGTTHSIIINHTGYYSRRDNNGIIIMHLFIKYSNSPIGNNGIWYEDSYWYAININLIDKTISLNSVSPDIIKYFEPIIIGDSGE